MISDHRGFAPAQRPHDAYGNAAAERIRRFVPMVRRLAWHLNGAGRAGVELEDLIQAGMLALTECARRHSGETEDGFAAYAKLRVRGAMVELIRRQVPLSRGTSERRRLLAARRSALSLTLGREPRSDELAQAMGIGAAELAALEEASEPVRFESLDEAYSDGDPAYADDRPDSFALLADAQLRNAVAGAIAGLPARLQLVVQLYFVEELNLAEIAASLQVSIPRVHQLKAQALDKLRGALGGVAELI
jgi:RNA polymerase sigma factor for flagellar operon FliA